MSSAIPRQFRVVRNIQRKTGCEMVNISSKDYKAKITLDILAMDEDLGGKGFYDIPAQHKNW